MIKVLQKRFVMTAMTAITILLIFLLGLINTVNGFSVHNDIEDVLSMIEAVEAEPGGKPERLLPEDIPDMSFRPKSRYDTFMSSNFFIVRFDASGNVIFSDVSRVGSVTGEQALDMAEAVYNSDCRSGREGRYRYCICENKETNGISVIFLDTSDETFGFLRVLFLSIGAGILCWLAMLLLTAVLSARAVAPVAESMEKQKQFITNAGHEIKTPLAVIRANTEALELYTAETKWSRNIKKQTDRLNELTGNLLIMARLDEQTTAAGTKFSLSRLLKEQTDFFAEPMKMRGILFENDIEDDISTEADRDQTGRLISIFLDNALKYTNENGKVTVSLMAKGHQAVMEVRNTCDKLPEAEPDKLFERFFRADKARTQKQGGSGIGLSAAASIAAANRIRLKAGYKQTPEVIFTAIFDCR